MSLGMPTMRPRLTTAMRIMGFLRMEKTETRLVNIVVQKIVPLVAKQTHIEVSP